MNKESLSLFLSNNEQEINKLISKFLFLTIPVCPILLLFKAAGVFPNLQTYYILLVEAFNIFLCVSNYIYVNKKQLKPYHKYILLLSEEIIIFSLSIEKGVLINITYAIVIILSSMYFNSKFTFITSITCILFTILSRFIKPLTNEIDYIITSKYITINNKIWLATALGSTIELSLISIFSCYLSQEVKKVMIDIYERKKRISKQQKDLILGLSNIVEAKDLSTGEHIKRTSEYVRLICEKLQKEKIYTGLVNPHTTELMVQAAPFHDLGKLSVPDEILNKPGKLTNEEFETIKQHPINGSLFIENDLAGFDDNDFIRCASEMTLCHHERFDGKGYPYHLSKDDIPISARIMSVADILDALLSERPYKKPFSLDQALDILNEMKDIALDPVIVDILFKSKHEITLIQQGVSPKYD